MPSVKTSTYKTIHEAVKKADVEALASMVKDGASVNELQDTKDQFTPVHWACYKGALECLHWLLWHGADATVKTTKGWTAAHIAAIRGQDACIQALANNGVNLSPRNLRGSTPLHMAAAHGNSFTLQTLLRSGVEVIVTDKNGWTPLHYAAYHGRLSCLQHLMRWGGTIEETDSLGNTAAHLAAMEGQLECLKFIVGESQNSRHILGARNNNGDTPKMLAIQFYKQQIVEYAYNVEWESEHPEQAQNLAFPAHVAAYDDDLGHLRMLVENQIVNINERDDKGSTPAHKAAGQGNLEVLQWLMEMGGDMSIKNNAGETPRDVARRYARLAAVRMLSESGSADEAEDDAADRPDRKKGKKSKKQKTKEHKTRRVETILGSDGEEVEVDIDDDDSLSDNDSDNDQSEARGRAKRKIEKLEAKLESETTRYRQLGGTVRDREERRLKEERELRRDESQVARRVGELEALLEAERSKREKIEARIEKYNSEAQHLAMKLNQDTQSADESDRHVVKSSRKKKLVIKKRASSKDTGTFVHRKGNFKIV